MDVSRTNDAAAEAPTAVALYERATASARETRGHVMTMATGSLAVFFLALTAKVEPALTAPQKRLVGWVVVLMAAAICAGLWGAFADARWSHRWATHIESGLPAEQGRGNVWHAHKRISEVASLLCFAAGVALASVYLWLRAFV